MSVDPTDPNVLYVEGPQGLLKTDDAGVSWRPILSARRSRSDIAVSPADPLLVYLDVHVAPDPGSSTVEAQRWLRSRDKGATWDQIDERPQRPGRSQAGARYSCDWDTLILEPHPAQRDVLFRSVYCPADGNTGGSLEKSTDGGTSWSEVFDASPGVPRRLVGGQEVAPGRFYLGTGVYVHPIFPYSAREPTRIFRTDDDGASWTPILAFRDRSAPLGGLAVDPTNPDRVYEAPRQGGVNASADAGNTWSALGLEDPKMNDLAVGIDGSYLFAATDTGVWRLRLR
jgi:photosystem II stability/assembly factor-like uncharacterized protein